jgi:alpha-L-rhamnosidase
MANAFPIFLGLVEERHKKAVLNNLVLDIVEKHNGHLTTGVLGSKYMIEALTMENRADIAWLLATATGYPSWSDMVEKYTTMCEFWTLKQSHNHVFTGSIDAWFYKGLAGIRLDENNPAFKNIIIKPYIPKDLSHAKAKVETIAGTVASGWIKQKQHLILDISIPFNSTATVYLPVSEDTPTKINGNSIDRSEGIKYIKYENNHQVYSVLSGDYQFLCDFN